MDVTRVDLPVTTRAPTGQTAAYVLGSTDALLVDPATRTDTLDATTAEQSVSHVAVTHHHPDHAGAVAEYAGADDVTVWARRGRTDAFERATGVAPDRFFAEGTHVPTGDGPVRVMDTPGHAPEHVAFVTDDGVVSGDLAVAGGSVAIGAPEGDLRAYLTSLRRVHALAPTRLYPGHGPTIDDPRATCRRLVAHRRDREQRVRRAIHNGATTAEAILDAAYDKDLTGVRDLARATVVAHLEKLAVEGDIAWDGQRATPR